MNYENDRAWSDKFIPEIKRIVGPHLLESASPHEDQKHAADLIVLNARDKRIAARVRRAGYSDRYPYDFTIRSGRPSGVRTELEKIIEGFGDWMFYGHSADDATGGIARWMLIDLDVFRSSLILKERRDRIVNSKQTNADGTVFLAFDVRSFPPEILVAGSHKVEFADRELSF